MRELTLWRWTCSRWWHHGGAATLAMLGAAMALLLGSIFGMAALRTWQALQDKREQIGLRTSVDDVRVHPPESSPIDFTIGLPRMQASLVPRAMTVVQDAAQRAGVAIESMQVKESAPTVERLGSGELNIVARGSYAALKRWLAEIVDRVPASTVPRLQLQRAAGVPDLEARITLRAWSRPAAPVADR